MEPHQVRARCGGQGEREPFYVRITDLYLEWSKSDEFAFTVGKQGTPFTMDGSTSSKELLAIDRSNLANNMWFPQEYIPGVSASGEINGWHYHSGVFTAGEMNREFGEFNGSVFTLASIGRDFAEALGTEEALLRANYVYQNPDPANTFTRQLHHMVSVNLKLEDEKWGACTDVSTAKGYLGQSDLWGVMIMPYFNVTRMAFDSPLTRTPWFPAVAIGIRRSISAPITTSTATS